MPEADGNPGGVGCQAEHVETVISSSAIELPGLHRAQEAAHEFDAAFIELARAVYVTNDERAALKRRINTRLGSQLVEEKSYKDYRK